jgi:hypothetical protein
MNKKILICLTALVMTGNYTSVTTASDSGSNGSFENGELSTSPGNKDNILHNVKNIKNSNIKSKILDDCKTMSNNNSNNDNEVLITMKKQCGSITKHCLKKQKTLC